MADTKISALAAGTPAVATDVVPIARAGANYKLTLADIWTVPSGSTLGWSDVVLNRDAANTLALRNSTAAQTFNIYNTFTDASNYERVTLSWTDLGSVFSIAVANAGSGTLRDIRLYGANIRLQGILLPQNSDTWTIGSSIQFWQTAYLSRSIQGSKTKALTESSATTFVTIAVPQTAGANFAGGEVIYTVYATDTVSGDGSVISGVVKFAAYNKAGTVTSQVADVQTLAATSGGATLTAVITATTSGDNVILQCNALSSLTQTTLSISYRLNMPQPNTVTPA